jgi:transcriptional regulator with XRE-family HTH domain
MRRGMEDSAIAKRLTETRLALGYRTQTALAEQIGILPHKYNPFERGKRRISLGVALLIWEKLGVSLDWMYCGDATGLPASLYKKLKRRR